MGAETYPTARPVPPSSSIATTATSASAMDVGQGQGLGLGDRVLAVEGPTDMGVLVYQMVQQTPLK